MSNIVIDLVVHVTFRCFFTPTGLTTTPTSTYMVYGVRFIARLSCYLRMGHERFMFITVVCMCL